MFVGCHKRQEKSPKSEKRNDFDIDSPKTLWKKQRKLFEFELKGIDPVVLPVPNGDFVWKKNLKKCERKTSNKKTSKMSNSFPNSPSRIKEEKKKKDDNNKYLKEIKDKISLAHREWVSYFLDQKQKIWEKRNKQIQAIYQQLQKEVKQLLFSKLEVWKGIKGEYEKVLKSPFFLSLKREKSGEEKEQIPKDEKFLALQTNLNNTIGIATTLFPRLEVVLDQPDKQLLVLVIPPKLGRVAVALEKVETPEQEVKVSFFFAFEVVPPSNAPPHPQKMKIPSFTIYFGGFPYGERMEEKESKEEKKEPEKREQKLLAKEKHLSHLLHFLPSQDRREHIHTVTLSFRKLKLHWCDIQEILITDSEGKTIFSEKVNMTYFPGWSSLYSPEQPFALYNLPSTTPDSGPEIIFTKPLPNKISPVFRIDTEVKREPPLQMNWSPSNPAILWDEVALKTDGFKYDVITVALKTDGLKYDVITEKFTKGITTPLKVCENQSGCKIISRQNFCSCPEWRFDPTTMELYALRIPSLQVLSGDRKTRKWNGENIMLETEIWKLKETKYIHSGETWRTSLGVAKSDYLVLPPFPPFHSRVKGGYIFLFCYWENNIGPLQILEGKTGTLLWIKTSSFLTFQALSIKIPNCNVFSWKGSTYFMILQNNSPIILNIQATVIYTNKSWKVNRFDFLSNFVFCTKDDAISFMPLEFFVKKQIGEEVFK